MPTKQTKARAIDQVTGSAIPGGELIGSTAPTAGPAVPTQPGPTNLTVASNQIMFSAVTPQALVGLTWDAPPGIAVAGYIVEAATDSNFTTGLLRREAPQASASLELPTGTLYYFRVASKTSFVISGWSNTASVTTATDTTPPALPTSLAATFNAGGDLEISWVNPTSANFRDVEVSIYADSGFTTLLYRAYTSQQRLVWTATQNRQAGSGTPDPAVFVRMASRSWAGVLSATTVPTTQPVKAVPANVSGLTQSWSGDAGTAPADLVISWSAATGASFYRLSIDGVSRDVVGLRYVYPIDQNRSEHSGTPDPVLSLSIVGVDGLDQVSGTATTATATNAAPAAPTVSLTAFFATLSIAVTSALPVDGVGYRFRLIQTLPSAGDITWDSQSQLQTRAISAAATYQIGVRAVDLFGQLSTETLTSAIVADALTLADLRAAARYSDSLSTSPTALKAALADNILIGSAGGVSPAFVAASALAVANSATSVSQTPPTGVQTGDLMIAHVVARGDAQTIATTAGWSLIANTDTANTTPSPDVRHAAFWRIARSNETTAYTFTIGSSNTLSVVISVYRGVDATTPINASASQTTASSTTITAPTITTTVTNTLLVFLAAAVVAQTSTPNGSLVERYDANGGSNVVMAYGATEALAASGATGTRTATTTAAAATIGTLIALAPATSTAISYALNAGWVRWVRYERDLIDRYETVTLALAPASGTTNWYLRTSQDGSTWTYYSGPVVSSRILTQVANEAAAQSAAISAATLGGPATSRVELPDIREARYVELWLRNTAAATLVSEFYPRRIVQADDLEAESIRAINIAAGAITADRLSVNQLSAIAADVGTVTFGSGVGILSPAGITLEIPTVGDFVDVNSYQFVSGGVVRSYLGGLYVSPGNALAMRVLPFTGRASEANIEAEADAGGLFGQVLLRTAHGSNESSLIMRQTGTAGTIDFTPGTGSSATLNINSTGTSNSVIQLGVGGSGNRLSVIDLVGDTTYTDYGLRIVREGSGANANCGIISRGTGILYMSATDAGSVEFYTSSTRRMQISSTGGFGFFGATAVARPTVTGSRGGNAALASLLTGLANLGLITDSSSA